MKRISACLLMIASLAATEAMAAGWTTNRTITQIAVEADGHATITLSASHENPDQCANDLRVDILTGSSSFEARVAGMYSAMLSGAQVRFKVEGCNNSDPIATVTIVEAG